MKVIDSNYREKQTAWRRTVGRYATPAAFILVAVSVIAWAITFVLWQQDSLAQMPIVALIAIVCGVLGVIVPTVGSDLRAEADQQVQAAYGDQQLVTMLGAQLADEWTLLQHVQLPERVIDAVLVGPTGVYAVAMVFWNRPHHNEGRRWLLREDDQWIPLADSPTDDAQEAAAALQKYVAAAVAPRVAWVSHALLLPEEPAVPVWLLNQPEPMVEDIQSGATIAELDLLVTRLMVLHKTGNVDTADQPRGRQQTDPGYDKNQPVGDGRGRKQQKEIAQ